MVLQFVGVVWKAVAPGLADHLWQSTLFAAVSALLTLALRRNSARLRYAVWLVASLKFLVPSSVLVAAGSLLSWRHAPVSAASGMFMVEVVGQPFTRPLTSGPAAVVASTAPATLTRFLPLLPGLWMIGFVGVLAVWIVRWRRVAVALRNSTPLSQGREYSTLRRLEELQAATAPVQLMQSDTSLEPGVFGILRPVLLWPRSVSEHLDDAHLEAVIAHELCHVRRRDNLAAAVHMLVEAIFWFHPLVWWIGAQLITERERACDEAVIELGSHRHTYAESILKVCEFCLSSPLTCVSGVTGADLKKRMVHIMTDRVVRKLNFARKLLLWTAACLAIALPIVFGLFTVTPAHANGNALDQFSGSWQSKYKGRTFFTLNMAVKDGLLTGTAVHSTRIKSQNGELVPDGDDNATDMILEAHVSDQNLLLKIEDAGDPSDPMPLELRLTGKNQAEGKLVADSQSGAPQQTKPWRFVRVSDSASQDTADLRFSSVSIQPHPGENTGPLMSKLKVKMMTGPKGLDVTGVSLHFLLRATYQLQEAQLLGEPEWAKTQRYDIEGKIDPQVADRMRGLGEDQAKVMNQQMMRQFLVDYFKLSVHQESRDLPVYELVPADNGSKLKASGMGLTSMGLGEIDSKGAPLSLLTAQLSEHLGRTIVDKTGLQGTYTFNLHWTPDAEEMARIRALTGQTGPMSPGPGMQAPAASGPDLITAVQDQLGLKLQPATDRVPVLVVDHLEQPQTN